MIVIFSQKTTFLPYNDVIFRAGPKWAIFSPDNGLLRNPHVKTPISPYKMKNGVFFPYKPPILAGFPLQTPIFPLQRAKIPLQRDRIPLQRAKIPLQAPKIPLQALKTAIFGQNWPFLGPRGSVL